MRFPSVRPARPRTPFVGGPFPAIPTPFAPALPGFRDWDGLSAIRDLIEATGAFDGVHLSAGPEDWGRSAEERAMAVVQLIAFDELDAWDDESDVGTPRHVTFTVTVHVRDGEPETRDREADRLANVVQDAIDGRSLAGVTYPGLTRVRRGQWQRARPPERVVLLAGEFSYEVAGFDGHDTTV